MCLLVISLTYGICIVSIIINGVILNDYVENWKHCTGGNFLHDITIFALISTIIGIISANSLNIIMLILYYAMGYNAVQEKSGNCQIMEPELYNLVLYCQSLMNILLFMSIFSLVMIIYCSIPGKCRKRYIDDVEMNQKLSQDN
jgi:hypothetical protein